VGLHHAVLHRFGLVDAPLVGLLDHRLDELRALRTNHGCRKSQHHTEDGHCDSDVLTGAGVSVRMCGVFDLLPDFVWAHFSVDLREGRPDDWLYCFYWVSWRQKTPWRSTLPSHPAARSPARVIARRGSETLASADSSTLEVARAGRAAIAGSECRRARSD